MMEHYLPFTSRLTDFFERTETVLEQLNPENPECEAVKEKLLIILGDGKETHPGTGIGTDGPRSIPDIHGIFDYLRKIFVLLKCIENKNLPACAQLSMLLKDCTALIAQSISSVNILEKERRRSIN